MERDHNFRGGGVYGGEFDGPRRPYGRGSQYTYPSSDATML